MDVRARRTRLLLASAGIAVALLAYLGAPEVNAFVVTLLVLAMVPYALYAGLVRSRAASLLGGLALLIMPVLAYGDFYLDRHRAITDGANFGFATVPLVNLGVAAVAIGVDRLVLARR